MVYTCHCTLLRSTGTLVQIHTTFDYPQSEMLQYRLYTTSKILYQDIQVVSFSHQWFWKKTTSNLSGPWKKVNGFEKELWHHPHTAPYIIMNNYIINKSSWFRLHKTCPNLAFRRTSHPWWTRCFITSKSALFVVPLQGTCVMWQAKRNESHAKILAWPGSTKLLQSEGALHIWECMKFWNKWTHWHMICCPDMQKGRSS